MIGYQGWKVRLCMTITESSVMGLIIETIEDGHYEGGSANGIEASK